MESQRRKRFFKKNTNKIMFNFYNLQFYLKIPYQNFNFYQTNLSIITIIRLSHSILLPLGYLSSHHGSPRFFIPIFLTFLKFCFLFYYNFNLSLFSLFSRSIFYLKFLQGLLHHACDHMLLRIVISISFYIVMMFTQAIYQEE